MFIAYPHNTKIQTKHTGITQGSRQSAKSLAKPEPTSRSESTSDKFSPAEKEELENWSNRLRSDLGGLHTPPAGDVKPEMAKARDYLADVMDKVAGQELSERDIEFHIELFSGDIPQAGLDDNMSAEAAWKEDHPDKEWPVRSWLGVPSGSKKPIYRLAVNLGMLRELESEDELAFVLSQQAEILLDHDKKDPYNEELLSPANQNFVDPREMRAEADKAAIARMHEAGYNPRGALKALDTLYSLNPIEYPDKDLNRGLLAAAHDQEHQGMRVGLVQAEVESYVRRQEPTTEQPLKPIPANYEIEGPAGYQEGVKDLEQFKKDYQNLALKLAGDKTPDWMFRDGIPPKEMGTITLAGGSTSDREVALRSALTKLQGSEQHTPQQKVDGFLRLLVALRHRSLPGEGLFSAEAQSGFHSFLKDNGQDWNSAVFVKSLKKNEDKNLQNSFVSAVVFNESFQDMAKGNLAGLARHTAIISTDDGNGKMDPDRLPRLVDKNHSDGRQNWGLAQRIDVATLDLIENLDAKALAAETTESGANRAMTLSNELLGLESPQAEFQLRLQDATQHVVDASAARREEQAKLKLRPPFAEPKKLFSYLEQLGQSETWAPFSNEFEAQLPKLLKDMATVTSTQPDIIYSEGRTGTYPENLEKRMAELYLEAKPEDKGHALRHLTRHLQHTRRIRGRSPRREWLGQVAETISRGPAQQTIQSIVNPDLSQHSKSISKTLTEGYNLKPSDLPDTSTPSLKALNERVQAGEFEPNRENFQSDAAYDRALDQYRESQGEMYDKFRQIAPMESRLVIGQMALIGHNKAISAKVTEKLPLAEFTTLLKGAEGAKERAETLTDLAQSKDTEHVAADAGAFLMDGFVAVQEQIPSLEQWHDYANRSIDFSNGGLEARVGTKRKLGQNLFTRLEKLEAKELRSWLGKDKVLELLSPTQSSELLVRCLGQDCKPATDLKALAKSIDKLDQDFELTEKHPVAFNGMRDKVAEKVQLQPSNVDQVFPAKERGVTDINEAYQEQARALSGLIAIARERSPQEQLNTIEYLMGRQEVMPSYLEKAAEAQSFAPLNEALQTTRQDLLEADSHTRVMVANSFLAGPSGILRSKGGKKIVIDHFLKNLHEDNRDLGEKIARGVLYSHGEADTLAVAYILGQKPEDSGEGQDGKSGKLDEATILNRLFDAYGVPGIKMKQYLAFTSEFSDFKDVFEDAQDAAMPLNYYQVLKLVQKRFGDEWPEDLKIDRVLGSGSVNVAIRYRDKETGKREVVSLGREDIQESTQYDFQRFHKFIEELTKTPEDRETFGYVLGLLNLIEASVALEFEKEQAMSVQKMAYKTYRHKENGWTVKSIDAHRVSNLGLFMEEAKGKTARKILMKDEETYNEAMTAMSAAEFGILKGQTAKKNWRPKDLFANPDFHDGQVMIDKDNKTVTILDFGQAVPINNDERKAGLDLLTIIGKADSAKAAAKRLNKRYFDKEKVMTPDMLEPILEREDRMDCFIHLLSAISRSGAEVPLSAVHWVLGVNRQMALTEKIGKPIDKQIRNMVITHKVGMPLSAYNAAASAKDTAVWAGKVALDTAVKVGTTIIHTIGGWFGWEPSDEQQQQQLSVPKKTEKPEVKYPSWRPDFGGTMPGRNKKAAEAKADALPLPGDLKFLHPTSPAIRPSEPLLA